MRFFSRKKSDAEMRVETLAAKEAELQDLTVQARIIEAEEQLAETPSSPLNAWRRRT